MHYVGNVIRPPSEAHSIILQVTTGCSHNKCTFCGAYKDQPFAIKDVDIVREDLEFAQIHCRKQKRLFLADGDVLILSQKRLVALLTEIRAQLPWVKKVSLYGSAKSVRSKTVQQLQELKTLGLDRVYMGLESGCDDVLLKVRKKDTSSGMIVAANAVREAGLYLSVTALLGLGQKELSEKHAIETAHTLNMMKPHQIAVLTLMVLENTPLFQEVQKGDFKLLSPGETLKELYQLVENLDGVRCQFHANHASSYLPLAGRLPKDKELLLDEITMALDGTISTVPEHRRAL